MIVCFAFCLVYCNLVGITFMFSWSVRCCRAGLASVNRTSTLLWCTYRCFLFCGASSLRTNLTVCLFYLRTQLFRRTVIFLVLKCSCSFLGSKMQLFFIDEMYFTFLYIYPPTHIINQVHIKCHQAKEPLFDKRAAPS